MLIVMAGLPGSGKSVLAARLAGALGWALLSVDPVEAALWRSGIDRGQPTGLAAYLVAEALAREQLRVGVGVIVDAVNDAGAAREQWRSLAAATGQTLLFVEVFCSDETEHRRRLEGRMRGIEGFAEPSWESVVARRHGFEQWSDQRLRIDSMRALAENVRIVLDRLGPQPLSGTVDRP